jgi:hypothetical protein
MNMNPAQEVMWVLCLCPFALVPLFRLEDYAKTPFVVSTFAFGFHCAVQAPAILILIGVVCLTNMTIRQLVHDLDVCVDGYAQDLEDWHCDRQAAWAVLHLFASLPPMTHQQPQGLEPTPMTLTVIVVLAWKL